MLGSGSHSRMRFRAIIYAADMTECDIEILLSRFNITKNTGCYNIFDKVNMKTISSGCAYDAHMCCKGVSRPLQGYRHEDSV